MNKFEGVLLVSDIDGTLIDGHNKIPAENSEAIRYFKEEGGIFTIASGRIPQGITYFDLPFDVPIITHNGAAIYDCQKDEYLWTAPLDERAQEVIDHTVEKFPESGVEMYHGSDVYFYNYNETARFHIDYEGLDDIAMDYWKVPAPWLKAIFVQEPRLTPTVRKDLEEGPFAARYNIIQSADIFCELLSPHASKGDALPVLAQIVDAKHVAAVGDNENDLTMLHAAEFGFAVENAVDTAKQAAQYRACANTRGAVADVIRQLERML